MRFSIFRYINMFILKLAKITKVPIGGIWLVICCFGAYEGMGYRGFDSSDALISWGIWGAGYLALWFGFRDTFWKSPTDFE